MERMITRVIKEALSLGDKVAGVPHLVLVLVSESSDVSGILVEHGITYERVAENFSGARSTMQPDGSIRADSGTRPGLGMVTPDLKQVYGRAEGLGLAAGFAEPRVEDWLVALLYSGDGLGFPAILQILRVSRPALVESMKERGIRLPVVDLPPLTKPRVIDRQ